jgi:cell wall-associated NlpC family hydrolase
MSTDPELKKKGATGKGLPGEKEIDCSGAVCKVLKKKGLDRGNPLIGNNAQKLHNDSKSVPLGKEKDGDLITFKVNGDTIDHVGFLIIDSKTGEKFIAESSRSFNNGRIVPFEERIAFLDKVSRKDRNKPLEYHIRRL